MPNRLKFGPGCGCCGEQIIIGDLSTSVGCCSESNDDPDCSQQSNCVLEACTWMRIYADENNMCGLGNQDACIQWSGGTTFTGTAFNGATWSVTLAFDCTSPICGVYITSATVSLGGQSITWTLVGTYPEWYYEIDLVGLTCGTPPAFSVSLARHPRTSPPATLDVTISNVTVGDTSGNPFPIDPSCCAQLNNTFTLSRITPGYDGPPCYAITNMADYQYEMNPGNTECSAIITLSIQGVNGFGESTGCGIRVTLSVVIFRIDPAIDQCPWFYSYKFCKSCSDALSIGTLTCASSPSPLCGCGGTPCITVAGTIPA